MDSQRVASASAEPSGWAWDGGRPPSPTGQFPAGLRVLVVDDDPTCLKIIERMLIKCLYHVTICSRAAIALSILRERKGGFDLVLSDVYMPDMDGFKLLEYIGLEMDLPVIMMSADDGLDVVMKGVTHGACDYLIKPVSMEALKNIWQHVIRKKRNDLKELENSGSVEDSDKQKRPLDDGDNASSRNEGNKKNVKRKKEGKEEEEEIEEAEDSSTLKKPRVVWSVDLHQQFVAAVNQMGVDKAVPKKILELMNVPGLTRENVASHLQKYRLYLRRVSAPQHQGRVDTSFLGTPEPSFSSISSLDGFALDALAVSGQFPQNLSTLHSVPRRATNIGMDMSSAERIGYFNSDVQIANSSKIWPTVVQQANNKQMNLLCRPSTYMEPRQLGQTQLVQAYENMGLQVSEGTPGFFNLSSPLRTSSSFPGGTINGHVGNSLVMQLTQQGQHISLSQQQNPIQLGFPRQPQSRGQLFNGIADKHDYMVSSAVGRQMLSTGISGHVLGRTGTTINVDTLLQGNYMNTSSYGTVPQALYANFQNSCMSKSVGSCHPLVNSTGASNLVSTGMVQEAVTVAAESLEALDSDTNLKGVKDVIPNYDTFSELCQSKNQDWKLQNVNLSYESAQHPGTKQSNIDFGSSVSTHQDFSATLKDGAGRNTCTVRKEIFSIRAEIEHEKVECVAQHNNTVQVENSVRVKAESIPDLRCRDVLFFDQNFSNEFMSGIGRQQQEGVGQVEPEFDFDDYSFEV